MQTKISTTNVGKLAIGERITDIEISGFVARRLPSGRITYGYQYSGNGGRRYIALGVHGAVTADEARKLAKQYAGRVAGKADPAAEFKLERARNTNTVNSVLDRWLQDCASRGLRSAQHYRGIVDRNLRPHLGELCIYDLRRSDVANMIDRVTESSGAIAAKSAYSNLSSALKAFARRDDEFRSPLVSGMVANCGKRDRVLDHEELRDLWRAIAELANPFAAMVRVLLLTACRRDEVADMAADEIRGDVWTIPAERYKSKHKHVLPLVPALKAALPARSSGFLFSNDGGRKAVRGFTGSKKALDKAIDRIRAREGREPMRPWRLHDLRRTARSHMAAAGIADHIAERVLGHKLAGVVEIYNRHDYQAEKAAALTAWANYLERIINPGAPSNVIELRSA